MSQQLVKKGANGRMEHVNPKSWIEAIKDKNTGQTLVEILQGFNMYFLPYNGNTSATRCLVPTMLRKKGLWITYVKYDGNVYTEWYAANEIDDKSWGDSSNWRIGNNTLVGDITISANGNWVINGTETEFKAVGEKGNTPLIRVANNRLQVSYDLGDTYIDVTNNPVYTKFRWLATTGDTQANNVGRIQASIDEGKTWTNMSNDFTNNLHISRYIGVNESLPTSGIAEGTIYAKGPYYAEDDTLNDNPIYRLWVYAWKGNSLAWQDNGEFTGISAGVVQETGDSETEVMSQKAVTEKLSELGSEVDTISIPTTLLEFDSLKRYAGSINSDNEWSRTNEYDKYRHIVIRVKGGDIITYRPKDNGAYGAFLKSYNPSSENIEFSEQVGYSGRFFIANTVISEYTVPNDALYFFALVASNSETDNVEPNIFTYNGINLLESHAERIEKNTNNISIISPSGMSIGGVENGIINIDNGRSINSSLNENSVFCPNFYRVKEGCSYEISGSSELSYAIYLYDKNQEYIGYDKYFTEGNTFIANDGVHFVRIGIRALEGTLTKDSYNYNIYLIDNKNYVTDIFSELQCGNLSIIGDSISTYNKAGYKLDGYSMYYPKGDVDGIDKTYWGRFLLCTNGSLEVNASYSGSCASNNRQGSGYPSLCDRVSLLGSPDTIIIALGTNDSNDSVPIGDFDFDADIDSLDESNFASAYIKGIKMIKSYYPNARVICLMFMAIKQEYRNAVNTIANYYGLDYISIPYFESLGDDKHPSYKGMQRIANRLANIERDYAIEESKKSIAQNEEGIDSLNHIIGEPETMPIGITRESVYVGPDGSVKSSTNLYAIYNVAVKADTQIQLTCYTTSSVAPISIFKDDKYYPVVQPNNVSGINTYFYYVESDCTIALSGRLGSGSFSEKKLVVRKSNLATNELVTSLATKLSPLAYEQTNEVNQIIDGVVSKVSTNTRYIYYRKVSKGENVVLRGSNNNATKAIEWGLYSEIPSTSSIAISYGKSSDVGEVTLYPEIVEDGFLALSVNQGYHNNWGFYEMVSFRDYETSIGTPYLPSKIKYIPHRGVRNYEIPENTTYSVMFAALYGLKYSECDVRYTSDGIGVVMHDATINRTMYNSDLSAISEDVTIADNTYETLSQYVYQSTNEIYRTKLQTMQEYIDACAQWDICPIIQGSMSDADLSYCMQRLGDNWICYGGNFTKVRNYSQNVLCLTSASYDSVDNMVTALSNIGGKVGLSKLDNAELTNDYISACKLRGWEVMASYAYQHEAIPDAIRRGVTIVLSDNVGKDTNKILMSSIKDWSKFTHNGVLLNGKLSLDNSTSLSFSINKKGNYKIYAQFNGNGTILLPDYSNAGIFNNKSFPMENGVFIYNFLYIEEEEQIITINTTENMTLDRLIIFYSED